MIVLKNGVLRKATQCYFSRLQDTGKTFSASVYHVEQLSDRDFEEIESIIQNDAKNATISPRSELQRRLQDESSRKDDERFTVKQYSKYIGVAGFTNFALFIGQEPEFFSYVRARNEFPNAGFVVNGNWGCHLSRSGDWNTYILGYNRVQSAPLELRFTVLASKTKLTDEEIYLVIMGYLSAKQKQPVQEETSLVRTTNAAIRELAGVAWTHEEVNLPTVTNIVDGSALLEIIVVYERNYFLAEV